MEGEVENITSAFLAVILSLFYCYMVSAKLPKGKWRLISQLPILYVFATLPLYFTSTSLAASAAIIILLTISKLLLFAFDQGPLSSKDAPISLLRFLTMAVLPFNIKPKRQGGVPTQRKSNKLPPFLATCTGYIPIAAALTPVFFTYKEYIHPNVMLVAYGYLVFLSIEMYTGLSNLLVQAMFGLELEPPSNKPYLSTSVREFWGRRWNLTVTNILRRIVFKPVRLALEPTLGIHCALLLAVLGTFLVSGLVHELLLWYITHASPSWEMTMFFVVHGVAVVVEFSLNPALAEKKWRLPRYLSWLLTMAFLAGTGFWLYFPPVTRNSMDVRLIEETRLLWEIVKEKAHEIIFYSKTVFHLIFH